MLSPSVAPSDGIAQEPVDRRRDRRLIRALYTLAGNPDALALIHAADMDDLKSVIDAIRRTGHVTGTKTLIVLGAVTQPRVTSR